MYEYKDLEVVVYDKDSKGFICSYCCNGFTVHQLREVYGLGADLAEIEHSPRVRTRLRNAVCLICELPASRWYD